MTHISDCGKYRYTLTRSWGDGLRLHFIMLNPSTADAENDDRTISRCIRFAKRENYGGLVVLNLFAFRATNPKDMEKADDPVGPNNVEILKECLADSVKTVCAWGAHSMAANTKYESVRLLRDYVGDTYCLGHTSKGYPRHPLYVKGDQPLIPFKKNTVES